MFEKKAQKNISAEKIPLSKKMYEIYRMVKGEISLTDKTYGRMRKKIIHSARVLFASIEKFIEDDCLIKASSLAYTTIISLIPTLAVGLTFMSIGAKTSKDEIFTYIQKLLADYNLSRLNIDPYIDAISNLLDNAASIGGIGMIVLIFSATAVLSTLEHSLNTIWGVTRERSWILRMIYYWAVLTLGPLMLIAGTTAAAQISTIFSAANYNAVHASADGSVWAAGNKGTIRNTSPDSTSFQKITVDQIDFDNQRINKFDSSSKSFYKDDAILDEAEILKSDFTGIQFVNANGFQFSVGGYPDHWGYAAIGCAVVASIVISVVSTLLNLLMVPRKLVGF